jgi:ribosomal silencing factor RsfS
VRFKEGKLPSIKRIQRFLEHEQATDFKMMNFRDYSENSLFSTVMICSGVAPRHISRMAYGLVKALKEAKVPGFESFKVLGTRDSGWMIVTLNDFQVFLMTEEERTKVDLEKIWKRKETENEREAYMLNTFKMYKRFKKKKR